MFREGSEEIITDATYARVVIPVDGLRNPAELERTNHSRRGPAETEQTLSQRVLLRDLLVVNILIPRGLVLRPLHHWGWRNGLSLKRLKLRILDLASREQCRDFIERHIAELKRLS